MNTAVLSLDDVFVIYAGTSGKPSSVVALRGLSLDVDAGESVVINGPSGSGKSTLVHVVSGHVVPSAGTIHVAHSNTPDAVGPRGTEISELVRSGHIAVVSQRSATELLPDLRVLDNVALTARLRGCSRHEGARLAEESLARFGCDHLANRFPMALSAGEAQLVALAAALTGEPAMILADEPTGDLDRENAGRVYELLREYVQKSHAALLLVSHDPMANTFADRVATIRDGRLERMYRRSDVPGSAVAGGGAGGVDANSMPLVVDRRGWLRLPDAVRSNANVRDRVHIQPVRNSVTLTPVRELDSAWIGDSDAPQLSAPTLPTEMLIECTGVSVAVRTGSLDRATLDRATHEHATYEHATHEHATQKHATQILAPVTFAVPTHRLTVITGPSGIGKTTLLSVLGGLREPTGGTLTMHPSTRAQIAFSALSLGFAEEASVRVNVAFLTTDTGNQQLDQELVELLRSLGVDHLADRPVATLSGGERQRAGVARAVLQSLAACSVAQARSDARHCSLLLLDEPTSQLDETSAKRTASVLQRVRNEAVTVVCTTHDERLIEAADHVVALG